MTINFFFQLWSKLENVILVFIVPANATRTRNFFNPLIFAQTILNSKITQVGP